LGLGQQKAKINCIDAKSAPLFDPSSDSTKVISWISCGTEVRIIAQLPNGEFYLIEADISGRTMRGNIDKAWLLLASPSPFAQPASVPVPPKPTPPPSIIGSTYLISYAVTSVAMRARGMKTIRKTIHLYEDEEALTMDVTRPDGGKSSTSIEYEKVNFVRQIKEKQSEEETVDIESDGDSMLVPVRTEDDAQALARYVAQKSPLNIELIGDAWRVRKRFECAEAAQIGCRDFKELLDHNDADIVEAFYSRGESTSYHACFSDLSRRFFIIDYPIFNKYAKYGIFFQYIFIDGQSNAANVAGMEWPRDDYATIVTSSKQGRQSVGFVTPSELTYQNKFTNKSGGETKYSLSIRWSTGRFAESFSGKDEKNKPWNGEETGICVKLN